MQVGGISHVGGRANNEDAILIHELAPAQDLPAGGWVLAVADGMGGAADGEVASSLAIETLQSVFTQGPPTDAALALKQAYRQANEAVFAAGAQGDDRPGTTLVSAVVRGKYVTIANVGDSRAYLMRANQLTQITQDHSVVAEQVAAGTLSPEEERTSPQRNMLTAAIGTQPQLERRLPAIYELVLLPEDRLLLCSDGFYDVLESDDYLQLMSGEDAHTSAVALTDLATQRRTTDNVSAVVLAVGSSLATMQRAEIARDLAEHRAEHGTSILVPVIILVLITALVAAGVWYWMF
jgi:protein phosphatase